MVELFEKTANAYKVFNFNKWYNELKNKYLKATDYLEEYIKVKKWSIDHFTSSQYILITTNGVKSIHGDIKEYEKVPYNCVI